jgi:2-hydroxychromene-2-carboxylate isomerase
MLVQHYFDYKSPYAYLAQQDMFSLAGRLGVELKLLPYTLDIPAYLGSAQVDSTGAVMDASRNEHQWRRVRYSYMDCRREANRRGLTVRGPRKIFDSRTAHIGFLFANTDADAQRRYHEAVFCKFWSRELDIEDVAAIGKELSMAGFNVREFAEFCAGSGAQQLQSLQTQAESDGVFGVPSYRLAGQLFWGGERFERVEELLNASNIA